MRNRRVAYRAFLSEFPELHEQIKPPTSSSTLNAEFSPDAALNNPGTSVWLNMGNASPKPKQKKIIISLKDANKIPIKQLQLLHAITKQLEALGFAIYLSMKNNITAYTNQLIDSDQLEHIHHQSRTKVQELALKINIPASEIYFIENTNITSFLEYLENFLKRLDSLSQADAINPSNNRVTLLHNATPPGKTLEIAALKKNAPLRKPTIINTSRNKISSFDFNHQEIITQQSDIIFDLPSHKLRDFLRGDIDENDLDRDENAKIYMEESKFPNLSDLISNDYLEDDEIDQKYVQHLVKYITTSQAPLIITFKQVLPIIKNLELLTQAIINTKNPLTLDFELDQLDNNTLLALLEAASQALHPVKINAQLNILNATNPLVMDAMFETKQTVHTSFLQESENEEVKNADISTIIAEAQSSNQPINLKLSYHYYQTKSTIPQLANLIENATHPISISLFYSRFEIEDYYSIAHAIRNCKQPVSIELDYVMSLNEKKSVEDNTSFEEKMKSYEQAVETFFDAIENATYPPTITLKNSPIPSMFYEKLRKMIINTKQSLTLVINHIAPISPENNINVIKALAEAIEKTQKPLTLSLHSCKLSDLEFKIFTEAIANAKQPIMLDLSNNEIGDKSCDALLTLILNAKRPININLSNNKITNDGINKLTKIFEKALVPVILNLENNAINEDDSITSAHDYINNNKILQKKYESHSGQLSNFELSIDEKPSLNWIENNKKPCKIIRAKRMSYLTGLPDEIISETYSIYCDLLDQHFSLNTEKLETLSLGIDPVSHFYQIDLSKLPSIKELSLRVNKNLNQLPEIKLSDQRILSRLTISGKINDISALKLILKNNPQINNIFLEESDITPHSLSKLARSFPQTTIFNNDIRVSPTVTMSATEENDDKSNEAQQKTTSSQKSKNDSPSKTGLKKNTESDNDKKETSIETGDVIPTNVVTTRALKNKEVISLSKLLEKIINHPKQKKYINRDENNGNKILKQCNDNFADTVTYLENYTAGNYFDIDIMHNLGRSLSEMKKRLINTGRAYQSGFFCTSSTTTKKALFALVFEAMELTSNLIKQLEQSPHLISNLDHTQDSDSNVVIDANNEDEHNIIGKRLSPGNDERFARLRCAVLQLDHDKKYTMLKSSKAISVTIPESQSIDESDVKYNLYLFSLNTKLKPSQKMILGSLSAHDEIMKITLDGQPLTDDDIEITRDEYGFHTMITKKKLEGTLEYIIDTAKEPIEIYSALPPEVQSLIDILKNFKHNNTEKLDIGPNASPSQELDAMLEQRKGACRHRVRVFLHKIEPYLKIYPHLKARAIGRGDVHINLELSIDGGKTYTSIDLGGHSTKNMITEVVLPHIQFSAKHTTEQSTHDFSTLVPKLINKPSINTLLQVNGPSDIHTSVKHIRQLCCDASINRPFFYIESPSDLRTSLPRLSLNHEAMTANIVSPPAGLLYDFLIKHKTTNPPPVIIINWDKFPLNEIIQFNAIIDDISKRRADTTPIPVGTTILGLHSNNEKMIDLNNDSSFQSRHISGGIHDLLTTSIPSIRKASNEEPDKETSNPELIINLHQSPRWRELLVGKATLNGQTIQWQDGKLLQILNSPTTKKIKIVNPPVNDRNFNNLIDDLSTGEPLMLLDKSISLPLNLSFSITNQQYFPIKTTFSITEIEKPPSESFIINRNTFEQLLHGKIIHDASLTALPGIIDKHLSSDPLILCITEDLSDSQWSLLLDKAAESESIKLDLLVLPGVNPPQKIYELAIPRTAINPDCVNPPQESSNYCHNEFILSNDPEFAVDEIQKNLTEKAKIIDITEQNIDDLIYRHDHSLEKDHFAFSKHVGDVFKSLQNNETIILKGHLSQEAFNQLSSLFCPNPHIYLEGQKHFLNGKLILIANNDFKPPIWFKADDSLQFQNPNNQLFITSEASTFDNQDTAQEIELDELTEENTLKACIDFEKKRANGVKNLLDHSPIAVLEGPPGVGKSYFIRTMEDDPSIKIYREHEIESWATDPETLIDPKNPEKSYQRKILFRDEINLRNTDCSQDRDLFNEQPSIYANGKYYALNPKTHKVLYAQNPLSYGGDRHEPKLFQDFPSCKYQFNTLPDAFIIHRILKPIYETVFPDQSQKKGTQSIAFEKSKALLDTHKENINSIRDLQRLAINDCTLTKYGEKIPPTPKENTPCLCINDNEFILTESRFSAYEQILTVMLTRDFRSALHDDAPDGAKYNGTNGLILEGPPGVGKSQFIDQVLASEGYIEGNPDTSEAQYDTGKVYFRLRGLGDNLEILDKAFQSGSLLIIDEIDTHPLLENYINAYLTGEDMNGNRPKRPGFTVLSTANGAALKGRKQLTGPLLSRMQSITFNEYSKAELISILHMKLIPFNNSTAKQKTASSLIDYLASEYLIAKNSQANDAHLSFRNLYTIAENYFKNHFNAYEKLGFTLEQHKFMLAYQNHENIDYLRDRFNQGTLDPKAITPYTMEKMLKNPQTQGHNNCRHLFFTDQSITTAKNKDQEPAPNPNAQTANNKQ